jgi:hypothetical protein
LLYPFYMKSVIYILTFFVVHAPIVLHSTSLPLCAKHISVHNWSNCWGTWSNVGGAKYTGEWSAGKYHGKGIFKFSDGTVLDGKWIAGQFIYSSTTSQRYHIPAPEWWGPRPAEELKKQIEKANKRSTQRAAEDDRIWEQERLALEEKKQAAHAEKERNRKERYCLPGSQCRRMKDLRSSIKKYR